MKPIVSTRRQFLQRTTGLAVSTAVLAWESAEGKVWLSYDTPEHLMQRHHLDLLPFKAVEQLLEAAVR